jgi:hypothetical protein
VREEHKQYFDALEQPARLLVGKQVPRIDGEDGTETLRDTADVKDWQEAVKSLLVQEVRDRASRALEGQSEFLQTLHASIDLFKNNSDLIPNTKDFDVALANRFATMAKPYELRVEGKLQGYSIPVQPIIDSLRQQIVAERAAGAQAPAAAAGGKPNSPAGSAPAAGQQADPPQAGIQSKAGAGADAAEDFSTLFGTIGLPNLRI